MHTARERRRNVVIVIIYSRTSGHYFDDIIIPDRKHRSQNYPSFSTPRTILSARGAPLDGTAEGVFQGLITVDYEEKHLARIEILTVPGTGRYISSVKRAARKSTASMFDVSKPRLEKDDITAPLRGENGDLYSIKLDLRAGGYAGKKLGINVVANAQVRHRQLGHLDKRSFELMNRKNGNGVAFNSFVAACDVCLFGKSRKLAHSRKAKHASINAPFQLVYGDLMAPFKPTGHGEYKFVSKITDQFTKWIAVYLLCSEDLALKNFLLTRTSSC